MFGPKPFTSSQCGSLSLVIDAPNLKKPSNRLGQYEDLCIDVVANLRDPVGESTAARKMVFSTSGAMMKLRLERHVDARLTTADTGQYARISKRISSGRT